MVVLYNTERMTRVLKQLMEDGTEITADINLLTGPHTLVVLVIIYWI